MKLLVTSIYIYIYMIVVFNSQHWKSPVARLLSAESMYCGGHRHTVSASLLRRLG